MRRWPIVVVASLAGCLQSEAAYVAAVERHVAEGPARSCCYSQSGAIAPTCVADAEKICGFVRDAKVTSKLVERFGEDSGAMVTLGLSGPHGVGVCRYQVLNLHGEVVVDGGNCTHTP